MSKETGLGWTTLSVDDSGGAAKAIKNDVNSFDFATPRAVIETTGVDKSAMERLHGLADFSINLKGTFNDETDFSHDVFSDLSNARTVTLVVSGQTLANESLFTDYALERGEDGALTWTAPGVLADGTVPTWT